MPVWFENDAPNTTSRSLSFMSQLATGVPLRPSTPGAERVAVGDEPLGLERGEDRRAERLGQLDDGGHVEAGAVADHDDGPPGAGRAAPAASVEGRGRRGDVGRRAPGRSGPERRASAAGRTCTSSGSTRWATCPLEHGVLERQRHELGVVGVGQHGAREAGDVGEGAGEVEVLERAAAEHLGRHLPGDGQHRRPVDLGVVEAR